MNPTKDFILLIPCYNNPDGLYRSIKSIQYPSDKFEILIVDDGSSTPISTDSLPAGMTIRLIRIPSNQGIVNALNTGLSALKNRADYNYIARLDAGDTCHPQRFTKQVEFLNTHPDISLLGSWCRFENEKTGKGYDYITKTNHDEIVKEMHFKCSFIHPTVIFKKEILESIGYYPTDYPHAEDYAYFWKIMTAHNTHILDEILVTTAINEGLSKKKRREQMFSRIKLIKKNSYTKRMKFFSILKLIIILCIPYHLALQLKKVR